MIKNNKKKRGGGWLLYILKCSDGTFYTGITNDIEQRIDKHNSGRASRYTRSRLPAALIYKEGCGNKSSALKKECRIKALSRKEKEKYLANKSGLAAKRRRKRKKSQAEPGI